MRVLLTMTILLSVSSAIGASLQAGLDAWMETELLPYVGKQLATHPRFNGQSLRFVVFENGNPQATSNALAIRLRDRLREAAGAVPGVRLAWQPDDPHLLRHGGPAGIDCTRSEVQYLVGIELKFDDGLLAVGVRALDVEDHTTVPGFGKDWKGPLTTRQYRDFRRIASDPTFRGERDVPYDESQADLLAAHLAHDLGCNLLRQTDAEYVIAGSRNDAGSDPLNGMIELVSNNLAQYRALQFSSKDESSNAVIEGKAHRIDTDLYQYWVTVQAAGDGSGHSALSASAYVRLPEKFTVARAWEGPAATILQNQAGFLAQLGIVEVGEPRACLTKTIGRASPRNSRPYLHNSDCFALSLKSADDAVVFFLNHQLNNGLVRLADASCLRSNSARIVKSNQHLHFPLPQDALPSASWTAGDGWSLYPDLDTYYAVAASDSKAARALSRHVRQLPQRCTASVRPGLEGLALQQWLDELALIVDRWQPAIDWQTIRVKNVY